MLFGVIVDPKDQVWLGGLRKRYLFEGHFLNFGFQVVADDPEVDEGRQKDFLFSFIIARVLFD